MNISLKYRKMFGCERSGRMLRIGMLTSGGDCQALNAAMRGVVKGICSKRDIDGWRDDSWDIQAAIQADARSG